jgi:hypothetical protein
MITIIGITGQAHAGKDAVADILVRRRRFCKVALADPMKRFLSEVFGFSDEQLWGHEKEVPDARWGGLTPRRALQTLGTEWGRSAYGDVWVEYLLKVAKTVLEENVGYSPQNGIEWHSSPGYRGVIVSDVRFSNEADAIHRAGGKILRVERPGAGLKGKAANHVSEMGILYSDETIQNDGTLEGLEVIVSSVAGAWGA